MNALREAGEYAQLSEKSTARWLLGKLKLGRVDEVMNLLQSNEYPNLPERATPIQKAFFLVDKKEYIGAEQLLSNATHEDPSIRALYLSLRAYLFCAQKKALECDILATDANKMDPLSPFALQVFALGKSAQKQRAVAEDAFLRAENLSAVCTDPVCRRYRGVMRFSRGNNYTGAQEDLLTLLDTEPWSNDAHLYLARTYYNQKNRPEAKKRLETLRDNKWGQDWVAQMWLARMLREQEDRSGARAQYLGIYQTKKYGLEVVTDMMSLAFIEGDNNLIQQLMPKAREMVGNSARGHVNLVRTLRSIGELDLAEQYIDAGEQLAKELETPEQQEEYTNNFHKEREQLAVARWYEALRLSQDTTPFIDTLRTLSGDDQQITFLLELQELLFGQWTQPEYQVIPADEHSLVKARYYLFVDETTQALKQIVALWTGESLLGEKLLWTKRAIATRLQQTDLIEQYLTELDAWWWVPQDFATYSQKNTWNYVLGRFRPWMPWMSPFVSPERLWIVTQLDTE